MNNYTSLNIEQFKKRFKENNVFNTVLLLIATITAAVLATLLFILIQRRMNQQKIESTVPTPTTVVTSPIPTQGIEPMISITPPMASPSVDLKKDKTSTAPGEKKSTSPLDQSPQSTASPSPKLSISPTP